VTSLVVETDAKALKQMLDVNIVGTMLGLKHGLRAMKKGGTVGGGGSIINISSVAATIAFPGIAGYSATKSAVDRMTRVAAMEAGKLGYGVRVNCIYPGLVATAMGLKLANDMVTIGLAPSADAAVKGVIDSTPLGRLGEVADMADVAVFLASDAARFMTGTGLPVDGGMGM
jgi:NAD(P)-dependent dehydrogenase (short-subunit alcohol dehydrogenase family)